MPDEAGEGPPKTPSKKKEEQKKETSKKEKKTETKKEREARLKREAVKAREEELRVIRKGIEARAREVEAIEDTKVAFGQLSGLIKEGALGVETFNRAMEGATKRIDEGGKKIEAGFGKLEDSLGKQAEYSDRFVSLQEQASETMAEFVKDLDLTHKGIRKAAEEAVVASDRAEVNAAKAQAGAAAAKEIAKARAAEAKAAAIAGAADAREKANRAETAAREAKLAAEKAQLEAEKAIIAKEILAGPPGMPGGPPAERPPEYKDEKEDGGKAKNEIEQWIEARLRPIEERDAPFSERWYLLWPIETTVSSLRQPVEGESDEAKERRMEFYQKISQRVEDRRRLHDYQWLYKRASGVEAIINAASILPTGVMERVLREKGVVESMVKLQNLAKIVAEARRSQDKARTEEGKRRLERLEDQMKKTMLRFMNGETEVDDKGREVGFIEAGVKKDQIEERAASNRLGGRLFIVLGFTASYDISDFAGGDFFVARLMHLKNRFKEQAKEGRPWFGRDKLWKSFKPELFETKFGGGLLANKTPGARGKLGDFHRRFGLERAEPEDVEEDIAGRKLRPLKITNPEQFRQLNLKEFGVMRENMLAADWADALLKADEARKLFLKPDQYLDRPNMEHFLGLRGDFEHLKGDVKQRLFSLMLGDLIEFHKGPGFARRLFDRNLPLWEGYTIKNPDTGEETEGITFVGSDSERLGLASAWASGEIHKKVDIALGHNMINKSYAEWLLRKKINLFGIPGIGPVRATKEILDAIGWGGFLAAFFAAIIEFFRQIGKDLEKGI